MAVKKPKRLVVDKNLRKMYETAGKNLVNFRKIFLPVDGDLESPSFHYDWSDDLLHGKGHVCYEGFRESGKTSLILRAFPNYALLYPRDEWSYIVLIKSNQNQARRSLRNIVSEYMNNPLLNVYLKKVLKNTSDIFEVELNYKGQTKVVRIECYGKGASIRGLNNKDVRPSIIVMDDCQDTSDMLSEVVPENDWDWFLSDVMFLGQSSRIFKIANNLGERCIAERIDKNKDQLGFKFRRIPCADVELTTSAWEEKQTIDQIKQEREDFVNIGKLEVWLREKMCTAVNDEIRLFHEKDYRYYAPSLADRLADEGQVFATLDPASSKRKDACFRAIVVGALMKDGHWYILDVPYGRWDSIELMDKMFEVVRKWGVKDFGIEKGQYQQFLEPVLYREMTMRGLRFNVNELDHGKIGSKLERIKMMQSYFKSGAVWFPDKSEWLSEMKSELAGVTRDELKSEFVDLIDALAMLLEQMRDFQLTKPRDVVGMKKMQKIALT